MKNGAERQRLRRCAFAGALSVVAVLAALPGTATANTQAVSNLSSGSLIQDVSPTFSAAELAVIRPCFDNGGLLYTECQAVFAAVSSPCSANPLACAADVCGSAPTKRVSTAAVAVPEYHPCIQILLDQVNSTVDRVCRGEDAQTCAARLVTVSCPSLSGATTSSAAADPNVPCADVVRAFAQRVADSVCGGAAADTCATGLLQDACTTLPGLTLSQRAAVADPAYHPCIGLAMAVVGSLADQADAAIDRACNGADAAACADDALTAACTNVHLADRSAVAVPEYHPCIEFALGTADGLLDQVFVTACRATTAQTCVDNTVAAACGLMANTVAAAACTSDVVTVLNGMTCALARVNCPPTPQPPSDRDGDGVPDVQDSCPDHPGEQPDGCPVSEPNPQDPESPGEPGTDPTVDETEGTDTEDTSGETYEATPYYDDEPDESGEDALACDANDPFQISVADTVVNNGQSDATALPNTPTAEGALVEFVDSLISDVPPLSAFQTGRTYGTHTVFRAVDPTGRVQAVAVATTLAPDAWFIESYRACSRLASLGVTR